LLREAVQSIVATRHVCTAAKHAPLRRKSKDCLARNQDNASERNDVSISEFALRNSIKR